MSNRAYPKISLVGAGPGDPDLLTIKGLKAIQTADVILYDALVNQELLNHAPIHALKIYVGKRANKHRYSQEAINLLLVQYAFSHGHVVRLKGGDPFVFGRGHEEMTYAEAFDIETVIVPGISSCIALPELQKVPVTRRGLNQSFWVLTGTTKTGELSNDVQMAAQSNATAVILMGTRKLKAILDLYQKNGKTNTPAMVIQNGSLPNEIVTVATVNTLLAKFEKEATTGPGIIVIGEVVGLHPKLATTTANALTINHKKRTTHAR